MTQNSHNRFSNDSNGRAHDVAHEIVNAYSVFKGPNAISKDQFEEDQKYWLQRIRWIMRALRKEIRETIPANRTNPGNVSLHQK